MEDRIETKSVVFNEDCITGMKRYPDNHFDLAIVDPPYGIDVTKLKIRANKKGKHWDKETPQQDYFDELFRVSKNQIVWGMNFLNDYLGRAEKTLVWDKQNDGTFGSDYELAWTSFAGVKQHICRIMWYGYFYPKDELPLLHPTQKPVKLYDWILHNFAKEGDLILDTHLGSGSSRIAAYKGGFNFIGFEIDKEYYEKQEKRFNLFKQQTTLF
jgi:site-specific DNA-methyltransferase (adenine-specific)